mmetsp:Transcript_6501/g.9698  ORF Transcript_6501/g.9698 Transcript_6501/m.9698 type:complete len:308 (+) Transcript_6501:58-981(+)
MNEGTTFQVRQWGRKGKKRSTSVLPGSSLGAVRELTPLRENFGRRTRHASLPPRLNELKPVPIESLRGQAIYSQLLEQENESRVISAQLAAAVSEGKRLRELEAQDIKVKTPKILKEDQGPALADLVDLAERSLVFRPAQPRLPLANLNVNLNVDTQKKKKKIPPTPIAEQFEIIQPSTIVSDNHKVSTSSTKKITKTQLAFYLIAFFFSVIVFLFFFHNSITKKSPPIIQEEQIFEIAVHDNNPTTHQEVEKISTIDSYQSALRLLKNLAPQSRRRPLTPPVSHGSRGLFPLKALSPLLEEEENQE